MKKFRKARKLDLFGNLKRERRWRRKTGRNFHT